MPTAFLEVKGERFVVIPESEYNELIHLSGDEEPLPASLFDDTDTEDADSFVAGIVTRNLKAARLVARLTQAELARKMKKSQAMISGAERGVIEIGVRYWEDVLKACKLPKDWKPGPNQSQP